MNYFMGLVLAIGLAVPIAVVGAGIGEGLAVAAAIEGTARQPELQSKLLFLLILGLAFIDTLVIFAMVFVFILMGRLPTTDVIMKLIH